MVMMVAIMMVEVVMMYKKEEDEEVEEDTSPFFMDCSPDTYCRDWPFNILLVRPTVYVQVVPYMHVWWWWMPALAQCLQKTTTVL